MLQIEEIQAYLANSAYSADLALFPGTQVPYLVLGKAAGQLPKTNAEPAPTLSPVGSLVFVNDILASIGQPISAIDQLQMTLTLDLTVPETRVRELSHVLAAINQRLDLGNMGLNGQNVLYYRYHWQVFERQISKTRLENALDLAYQQVSKYQPRLQALAAGEMQLHQALNFS